MGGFLFQVRLVTMRELRSLLALPLFYILSGVFFLLTSLVYLQQLVSFAQSADGTSVSVTDSVIVPTFQMLHFFLIVQIPLLTMRVFSEDRASGMLDLLQTMPVRDWSVLAGKYLATVLGLSIYITLTASYPLITAMLGTVDWPVTVGSLMALVLSAGAYTAIGIAFSAASESQVAAAVLTYVSLFVLAFGQIFADASNVPALQDAARHFTVVEHVNGLLTGNIAPMDVAYFVVLAAVGLFLTARVLESRRRRSA